MHLVNGAPNKHTQHKHQQALSRKAIVKNTEVIRTENDDNQLHILESLFDQKYRPNLNLQCTSNVRTLKLYQMPCTASTCQVLVDMYPSPCQWLVDNSLEGP